MIAVQEEREEDVVQDQLARNGIDVIRGRAAFVDAHVLSMESGSDRRMLSEEHAASRVG